jgi:hypothetical protein
MPIWTTDPGAVKSDRENPTPREARQIDQGLPNLLCVGWVPLNPDIQISGGPRDSMNCQGMGAHDEKTGMHGEQGGEKIPEIVVQGYSVHRGRGQRPLANGSLGTGIFRHRSARERPGLKRQGPDHLQALLRRGAGAQVGSRLAAQPEFADGPAQTIGSAEAEWSPMQSSYQRVPPRAARPAMPYSGHLRIHHRRAQ